MPIGLANSLITLRSVTILEPPQVESSGKTMNVSLPEADLTPEQTGKDEAVPEQLKRILAADVFKNSRRCTTFLKHVVERKLAGRASEIKERNLGVEVFGRLPDYDTSSDPVVRITAGEVRRRLAQYYDHLGHAGELRIQLSTGSYVPEFRKPKPDAAVSGAESVVPALSPEHELIGRNSNSGLFRSRRLWITRLDHPDRRHTFLCAWDSYLQAFPIQTNGCLLGAVHSSGIVSRHCESGRAWSSLR